MGYRIMVGIENDTYGYLRTIDKLLFETTRHKIYGCTLVGLHETRAILMESHWVELEKEA